MKAGNVVELYHALAACGIGIWIDGGWSVDAVIGRELRPHDDLDIAIEAHAVAALRQALIERGFRDYERPDTSAWNFVMADAAGRKIDVHAVVFNENGDAVLGPPENGSVYPRGALEGQGIIAGTHVRCVAPEFMLKFKLSYPPRAVDRLDVQALCFHLGIPVPQTHA